MTDESSDELSEWPANLTMNPGRTADTPDNKGAFTIEIKHNKGILYEWSYRKGFIRSINFLSLKFTVEEAV